MNKRGGIFLGLTLGIFIWISGILILPFITDNVSFFRVALDCADTSISGGTKLSCLLGGSLVPYYIWFISAVTIGLIIGGGKE